MKLGAALQRLSQVNSQLDYNMKLLSLVPGPLITDLLHDSDQLFKERQYLRSQIDRTKLHIKIEGTLVYDLSDAVETLERKISFLERLLERQDLSEEEFSNVYSKLDNYRSTRDAAKGTLESCLWDTELLEYSSL